MDTHLINTMDSLTMQALCNEYKHFARKERVLIKTCYPHAAMSTVSKRNSDKGIKEHLTQTAVNAMMTIFKSLANTDLGREF